MLGHGFIRRTLTRSSNGPPIDTGGRGNVIRTGAPRNDFREYPVIHDGFAFHEMTWEDIREGEKGGYYKLDGWHSDENGHLVYRYLHVTPE